LSLRRGGRDRMRRGGWGHTRFRRWDPPRMVVARCDRRRERQASSSQSTSIGLHRQSGRSQSPPDDVPRSVWGKSYNQCRLRPIRRKISRGTLHFGARPTGGSARFRRRGGPLGPLRRIEPKGFTKVSPLGVDERRVRVISDFEGVPADQMPVRDGYRVIAGFVL